MAGPQNFPAVNSGVPSCGLKGGQLRSQALSSYNLLHPRGGVLLGRCYSQSFKAVQLMSASLYGVKCLVNSLGGPSSK